MARLMTSGAETKDFTNANNLEGVLIQGSSNSSVSTDFVRSGSYAYKCPASNGGSAYVHYVFNGVLGRTYYYRAYMYFPTLPSQTVTVVSYTAQVGARITTGGKLQLWNLTGTPAQIGSDSSETIVTGKWYRIELSHKTQSGAGDDAAELLLDGVSVAATTTASFSINPPLYVSAGVFSTTTSAWTVYVDDIALNDDQGANQNSWCGSGKVVLLVPTGDQSVDPLWTGGSGVTTGQAVPNAPSWGVPSQWTIFANNNASSTSITSNSVTLLPGRLHLIGVANRRSAGSPTLPTISSGLGLTWTQINTVQFSTIASPTRRLTVFWAVTGSSSVSGTITADFGGTTQDDICIDGFTISSIYEASPIVQNATNRSDSSTGLTVTLSAFASADNASVGFFASSNSSGGDAGTGFTNTSFESVTNLSLWSEARIGSDTTVNEASSSGARAVAGIAVEVDAAKQMWQAVSNLPPIGTASENDATQIEHAGGAVGVADDYAAIMTRMSDAGVKLHDAIRVMTSFLCVGEDVATGTKNLAHQMISPTGTYSGVYDVAPVSGALGTYPTNWTIVRVTDYNVDTSVDATPILTVWRPETTSRVASVCFMGIYVEYEPRLALPVFQQQSQMRRNLVWRKRS